MSEWHYETDYPLHCAMRTLAHNLAMAGGLCASFRAGDNFGFHMGSDESQCTCQWAPGHGMPYAGAPRCEQLEARHECAGQTFSGAVR